MIVEKGVTILKKYQNDLFSELQVSKKYFGGYFFYLDHNYFCMACIFIISVINLTLTFSIYS